MFKVIAAFIAFVPALLIGWLTSAWLPAIAAGTVWFGLLWLLIHLADSGINRLLSWASNLSFLRNP